MQATHKKTTNRAGSRALVGYMTALLIGLAAADPLHAADADLTEMKRDLVDAKLTGVCGVLQQMLSFQETTQMKGGDEFIMRFWTTEFARVGVSQDTYLSMCNQVITRHNGLMRSIEGLKGFEK